MANKTSIQTTAKNALANTGKAISSNPKTTLYVGVAVAAVIGIYALSRIAKNATDFNFGNESNAGGGNQNPNSPNTKPIGASITLNQAQSIAAALHQAMVVWNGTDEARIFDLLRGKTPKDFAMISEAFGSPRYDDMGDAFWPFPQQKLGYWLYSELNDAEVNELKRIMPGVL